MPLETDSLLVSNISFCNKEASNIRSNEFKKKIIEYLLNKYDIKIEQNVGFVKINQNILKRNLENNPHLVSVLSGGNPYYFFLTKIKGQNCCFYIDQKIIVGKHNYPRIIYVQYRFADYLFNDTLFTGELIKTYNNEWSFIISDLILLEGNLINKTHIIHQRIDLIYKILTQNYQPDPVFDICPLQIKKLFYYNQIEYLFNDFIPSLGYNSKAICFHTLNTKYDNYAYYFSDEEKTIFFKNQSNVKEDKLKKRNALEEEKTEVKADLVATLLITKTATDDLYIVYCNDENRVKELGYLAVPTQRHSHQLRITFNNPNSNGRHYFNCRYSKIFKKWIPIQEINKEPDQWINIKKIIDKTLE
jgi:hypothetical protein